MKLIKLDAIDSTNEFLKRLANQQNVENYTVVTAENQTNGKGQMGAKWNSEIGKNLIMSVLIKDFYLNSNLFFDLNIAVSMAIIDALAVYNVPDLKIKWPNDIMSGNKKIGGILIENTIKSDSKIFSVIGLGLNVNQTNFEDLLNASSLKIVCNKEFHIEAILKKCIEKIILNIDFWNTNSSILWEMYSERLFKKDIPMPFQRNNEINFMGIIKGVSLNGKLQILEENDIVNEYDIKEIKMLY